MAAPRIAALYAQSQPFGLNWVRNSFSQGLWAQCPSTGFAHPLQRPRPAGELCSAPACAGAAPRRSSVRRLPAEREGAGKWAAVAAGLCRSITSAGGTSSAAVPAAPVRQSHRLPRCRPPALPSPLWGAFCRTRRGNGVCWGRAVSGPLHAGGVCQGGELEQVQVLCSGSCRSPRGCDV